MTQAIEKRQPVPQPLDQLVHAMKPMMAKCLPAHIHPDRMTRIALTALRTTDKLAQCSQASFGASLIGASLLGLEPNTPLKQCYLLPYWSGKRRCFECQLIIGYQGMLELARRSGKVASLQSFEVMRGDKFSFRLDDAFRPRVEYEPDYSLDRDDYEQLVAVLTVCKLKESGSDPIVKIVNKQGIERRRMRGASGKQGRDGNPIRTPWDDDPVAMALKSGIRAIDPWIPKSSELSLAMTLDSRADRGERQIASIVQALPEATVPELEAQGIDLTEPDEQPEEQPAPAEEGRRMRLGRPGNGKPPAPIHDPVTVEGEPDQDADCR